MFKSNMTKRGKGLRKPQCSVCGSRSHRIETCSHPLAQRMGCLIAENRKLKGAKNQKSVEGKQNRPRKNKQFKKTARKRYTAYRDFPSGTPHNQLEIPTMFKIPIINVHDVSVLRLEYILLEMVTDPHKTSSSIFTG